MKLPPKETAPSALAGAKQLAINALGVRVAKMLMEGTANPSRPGYFSRTRVAIVLATVIANLARYADLTDKSGELFIADVLKRLAQFRAQSFAGDCKVTPMERFEL